LTDKTTNGQNTSIGENLPMITLSDDEVALLKSLLTALRGIKIRDIGKALVILSKAERGRR
jgi:predicted DNA-binding transcriptional regulator